MRVWEPNGRANERRKEQEKTSLPFLPQVKELEESLEKMKTQMDEAWQKGISTFPSFLSFLFQSGLLPASSECRLLCCSHAPFGLCIGLSRPIRHTQLTWLRSQVRPSWENGSQRRRQVPSVIMRYVIMRPGMY